jgi:hypothetical protein
MDPALPSSAAQTLGRSAGQLPSAQAAALWEGSPPPAGVGSAAAPSGTVHAAIPAPGSAPRVPPALHPLLPEHQPPADFTTPPSGPRIPAAAAAHAAQGAASAHPPGQPAAAAAKAPAAAQWAPQLPQAGGSAGGQPTAPSAARQGQAPAAAAESAVPRKKKPGRQRRTSVPCQVRCMHSNPASPHNPTCRLQHRRSACLGGALGRHRRRNASWLAALGPAAPQSDAPLCAGSSPASFSLFGHAPRHESLLCSGQQS